MKLRLAKKLMSRVLRLWWQPGSPDITECIQRAGVTESRLHRAQARLRKWKWWVDYDQHASVALNTRRRRR